MWKAKPTPPPQRTREVPDGSCLITESGDRYYVTGGKVLTIPSDSIFDSWSFPVVFSVPKFLVDSYPKGGTLGFRPGTVRRSLQDSTFYYFSAGLKHQIVGVDFFKESQIVPSEVRWASAPDIALHKEGSEIL